MKILNLTQHSPSVEQTEAGVVDSVRSPEIKALLNFTSLPTGEEIKARAAALAGIAEQFLEMAGGNSAMIGGAPYLMAPLENALMDRGIVPLYAYSERVSVEETLPDGSVKKTQVFKHLGFVRN